mmetsp:Transcript_19947/g.34063  ORF Transcript_19947/g.34063 Transcript_19947/m.34063 type:complete len:398 (-) Transcript_19947:1433-2626(-)
MTYDGELYSAWQRKVLTIIPYFSAPTSILASSVILFIILKDARRKLGHVYHRLVFGMSLMDVLNSINLAMSGIMVPKGTNFVYGAMGNTTTCDINGFFFQFGFGALLYSSFLCMYYVLIIRYGKKQDFISWFVEPFMHTIAILHPIAAASVSAAYQAMNPMYVLPGWCYLASRPIGCANDPDVDCDRGGNYPTIELYATVLPSFVAWGVIIICMLMVFCTVRSQENRMAASYYNNNYTDEFNKERTRQTIRQATLYIVCPWITFSFAAAISLSIGPKPPARENRTYYFVLAVMTKVFLPMQGMFNLLIFLRPRYYALQRRHPQRRRISLIRQLIPTRQEGSGTANSKQEQSKSGGSADAESDDSLDEGQEPSSDFAPELGLPMRTTEIDDLENSARN